MAIVLNIQIEQKGISGMLVATCSQYQGFRCVQSTLTEVLADIPQALSYLISVGADIPSLNGIALPEPTPATSPAPGQP